jgi:hypothetical protein
MKALSLVLGLCSLVAPADAPKKAPPAPDKELVKASAEESAAAPLPGLKQYVENATPKSVLPCPQGTQQYGSGNVIYCAVFKAKWGKGRTGPWLRFHKNGTLAEQGQYNDSVARGGWWSWDENGKLDRVREYNDKGQEHGIYVRNFADGKRQFEERYANGKKDGVAKMWAESGQLWTLATYKDGKEVATKTFAVDVKAMTKEEADGAWKKVHELEAEQKKLLEEAQKSAR